MEYLGDSVLGIFAEPSFVKITSPKGATSFGVVCVEMLLTGIFEDMAAT